MSIFTYSSVPQAQETAEKIVLEIYQSLLRRDPEDQALSYWAKSLIETNSLKPFIETILETEEYQVAQKFPLVKSGELKQNEKNYFDNVARKIVGDVYQTLLRRAPEHQALIYWENVIAETGSLKFLFGTILDTEEYQVAKKIPILKSRGSKREQKCYFVHIYKTGGLSVKDFLYHSTQDGTLFPGRYIGDLIMSKANLDSYEIFAGHFGGYLDFILGEKTRKAVLLREPIAQCLSYIRHIQRDQLARGLYSACSGMTLLEICESERFGVLFGNIQTRYLASLRNDFNNGRLADSLMEPNLQESVSVLLEDAMTILQEEIEVIGFLEDHDDFCRKLGSAWGLQSHDYAFRTNEAPSPQKNLPVDQPTLDAIRRLNAVDIALYDAAKKLEKHRAIANVHSQI